MATLKRGKIFYLVKRVKSHLKMSQCSHTKVSQLVADLHLKLSHLILPFSPGLRGSAEEGDLHGNSIEGAALGSYR